MSEFSDRPFKARWGALGDDAERMFELTQNHWVRFGLNRPNLHVSALPTKIRYSPDYLQETRFAEVVVLGHSGQLKLKVEKLLALALWDHDLRTELWVWDSSQLRWGDARISDVMRAVCRDGAGHRFDDNGKEFWSIDRDDLPIGEWHDGTAAYSALRGE